MYQLKKAWGDVVGGGTRSLLLVFALALGVWGLGSVAVAARVLGPDLRENFMSTVPPHAVVTMAPIGLEGEARDLALLRVEVRPDEWIPLWLYGVEDFGSQKVGRIFPESGAAVPPEGTMVIERNGVLISNLRTGSVARVRSGGGVIEVPVSGINFDPAQAPATQDHFIYAYTDKKTWTKIAGREAGHRVLLRFPEAHSKADVEKAVAGLNLGPDAVATVPSFEEHPHQWQLNLLMGIIGSIGLLSFLLSSVMVGQAVGALLSRQVRQIGILKAVGATGQRIAGIYAFFLGVQALAAALVSVPLAAITGQAFSAFVAGILNFNILTKTLPPDTWALLIAAALSLPFLFAAPTLYRAAQMPVREALADAGVKNSAVSSRLWWVLRNLLRRPGRSLLVVLTTALGVAIFSTGFNMRESLAQFLGSTRDAMKFDLQVVLSESIPADELKAPFAAVPGIAQTEVWTGGRGELQSRVASTDAGLGIVALPARTAMAAPRLLAGRWLTVGADETVLNQAAWYDVGKPPVGTTLHWTVGAGARSVVVVGVAEEVDKAKAYVDDALWAQWMGGTAQANSLVLIAADRSYAGVMALKKQLEQVVAASTLKVLYVISQAERTKIIADHLDIVLTVLLLLASLVLWVAALGTAASASITVLERTREIGVLRAIGAGPRRIVGLFVLEGMTASAAGLVIGLLLSIPLSLAASSFFGTLMLGEGAVLRFAWSPAGAVITVGVTLVLGWFANRSPARSATKISTRRALAYE